MTPDATDLPGLLDDIGHYAVALCAQQDNRFVYRPATPLPRTVSIDGMRLQQVLLNLLSNASKFTRDGTVTLSIHAAREGDTGACCSKWPIRASESTSAETATSSARTSRCRP